MYIYIQYCRAVKNNAICNQTSYIIYHLNRTLSNFYLKEGTDESNIIVIMRDHQTFSLTTILNSYQLQPHVYNTLIHQIKSPLQEQSIDLTNDNSLSIERAPKRPNIPPPPPKSPLYYLNNEMSRTYQSFSLTMRDSPQKNKQIFHDQIMESILSPLDDQISRREQKSEYVPFCGGVLDSILESEYNELELFVHTRSKNSKRRPIFQKFGSLHSNTRNNKPLKSVQNAISTLKQVNEPQLAMFLQLLIELQVQLKIINKEKKQLDGNLDEVYRILSAETSYTPQILLLQDSNHRVLRRLNSKNTFQVISKILRKKSENPKLTEQKMQKLFSCLNKIQLILSEYTKLPNILQNLDVVFAFINQNFPYQLSLIQQLQRLFESLSIQINTDGLQLIWQGCRQNCLNRQQFIEGITLNDLIVRSSKAFEKDLQTKGFQRNS